MELTTNQQMAKDYLQSKSPEFVSPTEVGREVGLKLGKKDLHSAFGSPLCKRLVALGLAERNDQGHYRIAPSE